MTNKVYIMRGLPGSGKSSLGLVLASGVKAAVCSTDDFFTSEAGYRFNPSKLAEYHAANLQKFTKLCEDEWPVVVCDNTNMLKAHFAEYIQAAQSKGYEVHVITVGSPKDPKHQEECAQRNAHGVPLESIKKMGARYEP